MRLSQLIIKKKQSYIIRETAQGIQKIDLVPGKFLNCTELYLSHNSISTIEKIHQFHNVSKLMLEYNKIENIMDLAPLGKLPHLVELRLNGNPVCKQVMWDVYTIDLCKALKLLNGKPVERDKKNYKWCMNYESRMVESLYHSNIAYSLLKKLKNSIGSQNKASLIQEEYSHSSKDQYINKIRSEAPSKDKNSYMHFLKNKSVKMHSLIDNALSTFHQQLSPKHNEFLQKLIKLKTTHQIPGNEEFLYTSNLLSGIGLQAIGINIDDELTNMLSNLSNTNKEIEAAINLSKIDPEVTSISVLSESKIEAGPNKDNKTHLSNIKPKNKFTISNNGTRGFGISKMSITNYSPKLEIEKNNDISTKNNFTPVLSNYKTLQFEILKRESSSESIADEYNDKTKSSAQNHLTSQSVSPKDESGLNTSELSFRRMEEEIQRVLNSPSQCESQDNNETSTAESNPIPQIQIDNPDIEKSNSSSSFKIHSMAFSETIPKENFKSSAILNYSPKFLDNPYAAVRRRINTSSLREQKQPERKSVMTKIREIPNSFLGFKFYLLWKKRFQRRVNRRLRRRNVFSMNAMDSSFFLNFTPPSTNPNSEQISRESSFQNFFPERVQSAENIIS